MIAGGSNVRGMPFEVRVCHVFGDLGLALSGGLSVVALATALATGSGALKVRRGRRSTSS